MLILFIDQGLWVLQFCQVLCGNDWEFEMPDWEIAKILRMIDGRNMKLSNNLSSRNISKVEKCDVYSIYRMYRFWISLAAGKNDTYAQ